ncbi:MAG: hypothetical protein ACM3X5_05535, partial [Bacillota bacterium]
MSATTPPPPPRAPRVWPYFLATFAAGIALVVVGIAWFLASPGGARLLLDRVAAAIGEGTRIEGVEGSLSSTLRIKSIQVTRPGLEVHLEDVLLERQPGSDWLGRVDLKRLEVGKVEVRSESTGDSARLPLGFKPPYPVRVESGRIGELRWGALHPKGSSPPDVVVKNLVLKGEGDERSWRIERASADTSYGQVSLEGSLGTVSPFALDAKGDVRGEREGHAYRVAAKMQGTLKRIEAEIEAEAEDLRGTGNAVIEPFARDPVREMTASMRAVDLARFGRAPHTRLDIDATLHQVAAGAEGTARVTNADAGPLDRERLPIVSAQGRVAWRRDAAGEATVEWRDAALAFAGGGSAQASGRWQAGRLEVGGRVADVDLARWDTRLKPTKLSGDVRAVSEPEGQRFDVALHDPRFDVSGRARLAGQRLEVETMRLKHESGLVDAKGSLQLDDRRAFRFEGRAEHFDPSKLVNGPSSDINAAFVASGNLSPAFSGDVKLDIAQSRWAGHPASGRVAFSAEPQRIRSADAHVVVGDAHLDARGSFGRAGDAMQVALHAPDVAVFAKPFGIAASGRVDAEGTLRGTFAVPAGRFTLAGASIVLPSGWRAASLSARADVGADPQSRIDVAAEAHGIARASNESIASYADDLGLAIAGTRAAHHIDVSAARGKDSRLALALDGGIDPRSPRPTWRGELRKLELTGPSAVSLAAPATLVAAMDRVELGDATLKAAWGEAHLATTRWTPAAVELRGSSPGIAIREAARAARLTAAPRGGLVVAAQWNVRAAESVEGTVAISRVSGDLRVGDPPRPVGLEQLNLRLDVRGGR